jgi:hypothetical protein
MIPRTAIRISDPERPGTGNPRLAMTAAVICLCLGVFAIPGVAQELSRDQMKGLDEQVQEIKTDVLSIASELNALEERLLYPSNTQVAVFITLAEDADFRLDAVQIRIDGAPVAHHIYSFKELEALQKGGVQRVYTGNIRTGEHDLDIAVSGKLASGEDVSEAASFRFTKDIEPKLVGVALADLDAGSTGIRVGDW